MRSEKVKSFRGKLKICRKSKSNLRTEASSELQGIKGSRDGTSSLSMENEDLKKKILGSLLGCKTKLPFCYRMWKLKLSLLTSNKNKLGIFFLQALVKSKCENTRLTNENNRCMEEQGDVDTLQSELEPAWDEKNRIVTANLRNAS